MMMEVPGVLKTFVTEIDEMDAMEVNTKKFVVPKLGNEATSTKDETILTKMPNI